MNFSSDAPNLPNDNAAARACHVDIPGIGPMSQALRVSPSAIDDQGTYHFELADTLNLYFKIGCQTFIRHELLAYGGMNWTRVENCLRAWEERGLIQLLRPLAGAGDGEIVAKQLRHIDYQTPPSKTNK